MGLSQDHVSLPEQLFPMARRPCAGRAVPGSVGERWQGRGSDPEGSYRWHRESPPLHSRLAPLWEQLPFLIGCFIFGNFSYSDLFRALTQSVLLSP